jgi:hypothetical protein
MNTSSRGLITVIIALAVVLLAPVNAGPKTHSLNEDAALNTLLRALKHDRVYAKRISLDCVTFDTEEKTDAFFQFALRENHTAKCGGDPDFAPVIDRYRVYRASGKIEWLNAVEDNWERYDSAKIK